MSKDQEISTKLAEVLVQGIQASTVPQFLLAGDTTIILSSQGACRLLGLSPAELTGQPLSRFIPHCPDMNRLAKEKVSNGLPLEMELHSPAGQQIPVEVYCTVFNQESGQEHCLLVIHDISNTKFLDQERAARLEKVSLLNQVSGALYGAHLTLDQVLQGVLICVTAGQGLGFNRAFLLLIDEEEQILQGEIAIGPSNREEASRIWQDLAGQKADLFEMITNYDSSIKQTDVVVNEIVKDMSIPLNQRDHILIKALQERQAFRIQGDQPYQGAESIRRWLASRTFAVAPLLTRRGTLGVILADNAISGGEISDLDLEILQLFANESANAIENSRLYHELEQRLIELRKVSEQQRQDQETLIQMERLSVMGETSAIVAHELRNPLVAIGGFARTLLRSLGEEDPNHRYAAIITEEVGRLERIIHDLLDFIRPQKLLRKAVVLDDLVEQTARNFAGEMVEQAIELTLDLQASGVEVNVNPGEIQQVLQNLILNALQIMDQAGRLEVATRALEGGVNVEIRDSGPGIPPEVAEKIFTPFFTTTTILFKGEPPFPSINVAPTSAYSFCNSILPPFSIFISDFPESHSFHKHIPPLFIIWATTTPILVLYETMS